MIKSEKVGNQRINSQTKQKLQLNQMTVEADKNSFILSRIKDEKTQQSVEVRVEIDSSKNLKSYKNLR